MPLPGNVGTGTVTGYFVDSSGAAATGKVTFTPSPKRLQDPTASPPTTILPAPVTVPLSGGSFTKTLIATDDLDLNPNGWTYTVTFTEFTGVAAQDSYSIAVPQGTTVDLSVVAPVGSSNGTLVTRGASAYEVAVSDGYSGTLTQWLASLKGADGTGSSTPVATGNMGATCAIVAGHFPSVRNLTLTADCTVTCDTTGLLSGLSDTCTLRFIQPSSGTLRNLIWSLPTSAIWGDGAPAPNIPQSYNSELIVDLWWTGTVLRPLVVERIAA